MRYKAFTLIELLVVVAIIGILAAVGVVSYSGFTESAKENLTKSNHSTYVRFITAQLLKCAAQDNKGYLEVKSYQFQQKIINKEPCDLNQTSTERLRSIYVYHFENEGFRNAFDTKEAQLHPDHRWNGGFGTPPLGFSHITRSSDYKYLFITTSYKAAGPPLITTITDPRR